jgi:hypothetical protein
MMEPQFDRMSMEPCDIILKMNKIHENSMKNFKLILGVPSSLLGRKCEHEKCSQCNGTGMKKDKTPCIHYLVCNCDKCKVTY